MARRMNRDASALLPPSFWPSSCSRATHQVAEHLVHRRRALTRSPASKAASSRRRPPARCRRRGPWPRSARGTRRARRRPRVRRRHRHLPSARRAGPGRRRGRVRGGSSSRVAPSAPPASATSWPRVRASRSRTLICELVPPAAVAPDRLARRPSITKPRLLVGADRPLVEREHGQRDAVQPERPERVVEHQLGRLGAVALAPGVLLADRDVEQRRAVVAVELAERARADQPVGRRGCGSPSPANRCPRTRDREEALDLLGRASGRPGSASAGRPRGRRTSAGSRAGSPARAAAGRRDRPSSRSGNQRRWGIGRDGIPSPPCAAGARSRSASRRRREPPRRPRLLADYLRDARRRRSCRSRPSSSPGARSRRRTSGRPASAGRRSRRGRGASPGVDRDALGAAYDRSVGPRPRGRATSSPRRGPRAADPTRRARRSPRCADAFAAIEAASGPAAQGGDPAGAPRAVRSR